MTMGYSKNRMIELEPWVLDDFLVGPQAEEIWNPQPADENEIVPF